MVKVPLENTSLSEDDALTLSCKLNKPDKPVKWYKDGKILTDGIGCSMSTNGCDYGVIQILAAIFCPLVTCDNVPAISFHSILINLQYNFQTLNGKHFSQLVLSKSN